MGFILVVEDSQFIRTALIQKIESELSIRVLGASNLKEATEIVEKNKENIEVALLDLNLPDAPNGEVIDYFTQNKIPSVVLTGTISKDTREMVLKKNVADYIFKQEQFSIEYAVSIIKRLVSNKKIKVLVVDDSSLYLRHIKTLLEKQCHNVLTASNGQEAIEIVKEHGDEIKLVLTDYNMPKMDGLELTTLLRRKFKKDQLSIVVISGIGLPDIPATFLKSGANDFVIKPFTNEEFFSRINSNLDIMDLFKENKDKAEKDFLTSLYNRRYLFERGAEILKVANAKNVSITAVMLDIDHFKKVNDTYGHDAGDVAIKEVAVVLQRNLRKLDLIARIGGEEFCILLPNIDNESVVKLFEKIRAEFESNTIIFKDLSFKYTVSIGICAKNESTLDEMIKKADLNLYEAKESGRNRVVIS